MADESDEIVKNDEVEEDGEADETEEEEKSAEDEDVVPLRKSVKTNADFARERIALKGKKGAEKSDDEELTPGAQKLIEREVAKRLAPMEDKLAFRDYFAAHPDDRKYEAKALKRFEAWGTVPIEEVMKTLRPETDAEEKSKAEDKAKRGSIRGATQRKGEEQVASTEADFKKVYENVKRGKTGEALKQLGVKN